MKSVSEIEAEIDHLQRLRVEIEAQEAEKNRIKNLKEARELTDQLVRVIDRLHELGFVPPAIQTALTTSAGKFTPGMFIKRPRLPGDAA